MDYYTDKMSEVRGREIDWKTNKIEFSIQGLITVNIIGLTLMRRPAIRKVNVAMAVVVGCWCWLLVVAITETILCSDGVTS